MTKKPKSFRFNEDDIKKMNTVHDYYKSKHQTVVIGSNMNDLHKWSEAQTIAMLVRDKYVELLESGEVKEIEY